MNADNQTDSEKKLNLTAADLKAQCLACQVAIGIHHHYSDKQRYVAQRQEVAREMIRSKNAMEGTGSGFGNVQRW